jgi:predicted nucleic acid-binding protein
VSLVLDSWAAFAWIYADETSQAVRQVFEMVAENSALVPSLWGLEVADSLTGAVRRGRIDAEFRNAALADLASLDIATGSHTDAHDAAYLELAHRGSLPLASLDKELRDAGRALGVPLLGAAT